MESLFQGAPFAWCAGAAIPSPRLRGRLAALASGGGGLSLSRGDGRLVVVPAALEKPHEKVAAVHSRERAVARRSHLNTAQRSQLAERLRQLTLSSDRSPVTPPTSEL